MRFTRFCDELAFLPLLSQKESLCLRSRRKDVPGGPSELVPLQADSTAQLSGHPIPSWPAHLLGLRVAWPSWLGVPSDCCGGLFRLTLNSM